MIYAYSELYLDDAMTNLGQAFDYAVNTCKLDIDAFMSLFISTGYSKDYEKGNPKIIAGLSGCELAMAVISKAFDSVSFSEPSSSFDYSCEYWCGWIIAYYQYKTSKTFREIHNNICMSEIRDMYFPLHEASEDKFVDVINAIFERKKGVSKLQTQRKEYGYSQRELSDKACVNLRTLQQYELRAKDINKASVSTVLSLANALECKIEDLLE